MCVMCVAAKLRMCLVIFVVDLINKVWSYDSMFREKHMNQTHEPGDLILIYIICVLLIVIAKILFGYSSFGIGSVESIVGEN